MTVGPGDYVVASYYFPNYHVDKRNEKMHGEGWTEWELVKAAGPRFEGHQQPKVPAWGYTDEANPSDMEQKIDAAADHGIDAFIFDWYYYNDGLFLERGIEDGFFGAKNNQRIKFGLMWANHDWLNIFPVDSVSLMRPEGPELLYPGVITRDTWDRMTDYIIETYFKHPSYWLIDGAPYFSIYDLTRFMKNFGSREATIEGIEEFREKVRDAGFKDLHLNAVVWGNAILPSEEKIAVNDIGAFLKQIGFTSTTSYVWIHHVQPDFPEHDYPDIQAKYFNYAKEFAASIELPYYPNVTMGWDSSPRTKQSENFSKLKYPYTGTLANNSPENFKKALLEMRDYLDGHPESGKIFNINCWNEWTEGSYLEPDTIHEMAYLEAIREVFN
ncbi:MAG: glycoside hydrolase family 99-like domain-containing protein [Bacteroidales bacterium]|nr:glycoside hydrolase family 99-like domain-containing protein [Bacteroidales bacterium]